MRRNPGRLAILAVLLALTAGWSLAAEESTRPWVGVYLGQTQSRTDDEDTASRPGGVTVTAVVEDSPAERAGLRARDVILAVQGTPVFSPRDVVTRIQDSAAGEWVTVSIQRGRLEKDVTVRLVAKPEGEKYQIRQGWIGVDAIDLPPSLREHFGAPADSGVMVYRVYAGSPAESAGLEIGDVIFRMDDEPVRSRGLFTRRIRGGGVGNTLEMTLSRNWAEMTVEALIETRPDEELKRMERERIEREERAKIERKARAEKQQRGGSPKELEKPDR